MANKTEEKEEILLPTSVILPHTLEDLEIYRKHLRELGTGLEIKDRKYKGKTYQRCFKASELVEWTTKFYLIEKEEAVRLGRMLEDRCIVHHVNYKQRFDDNQHLWRFQEDTEELNVGKQYSQQPRDLVTVSKDLLLQIVDIYRDSFEDGQIGKYNRPKIKSTKKYKEFVDATFELQKVDVVNCNHQERLSFFVNVHNTLVLHGMIEVDKIPNKGSSWFSFAANTKYNVNGNSYSLIDIQYGVLRNSLTIPRLTFAGTLLNNARITQKDPRHRAIITKAEPLLPYVLYHNTISSPLLRMYSPETIDAEMERAFRVYMKKEVTINAQKNVIVLPKLFLWFARDFDINTNDTRHTINGLRNLLPDELKVLLNKIDENRVKIKFSPYNWEAKFYLDVMSYAKESKKLEHQREEAKEQTLLDKKPVFGMDLKEIMLKYPTKSLPPFLTNAFNYLTNEKIASLSLEELFVKSAKPEETERLKQLINKGKKVDFSKIESPSSVCQLLKQFLSELPEPLIPYSIAQPLIDLIRFSYPREKIIKKTIKLFDGIPEMRKRFVKLFFYLFYCFASRQKSTTSIATEAGILAPMVGTIVVRLEDASPAIMEGNRSAINLVVKIVIEEYEKIFSGFHVEI